MLAGLNQLYWVTWFPASLLAFCGILTLVWKGIVAFGRMVDASKDTQEIKVQVSQLSAQVQRIEYEFHPNGGQSMRDQVNALRVEQSRVATELIVSNTQMGNHIQADAVSFGRQERTNTRVEATLDRIEDHVRK